MNERANPREPAPGAVKPTDESGGRRTLRSPSAEKRLARVGLFLTVIVVIFTFRLWTLQLKQTEVYASLAAQNYTRKVRVPAMRGQIFDTNGKPLAENRPSYNLMIHRARGRKGDQEFFDQTRRLAPYLGVEPEELVNKIRYRTRDRFENVVVTEDVPWETMIAIEEHRNELKGVQVSVGPRRGYPFGPIAAHQVGFLNEISESELQRLAEKGYQPGDRIGRGGVEAWYESDLRGRDGEETIVVSAHEVQRERLHRVEPRTGNSLILTLDSDLQSSISTILDGTRGAIVVMDPRDGAILAMSSFPSFDPTHPVGNQNNLAVQGVYPPGSTFKILSMAAALDCGAVSADMPQFCPGYYPVGSFKKGCWIWDKRKNPNSPRGHGSLDFFGGMQRSCDVYFYATGALLGMNRLNQYAVRFGFGLPTGIDLPGERPSLGSAPSLARQAREPGEIFNAIIGQGSVATTPLQITRMTAAIASGGILIQPRIAKEILSPTGEVVRVVRSATADLELSPKAIDEVVEGLYRVVNVVGGTARVCAYPDLVVCGKTGSAQHERKDDMTHAWFTCFAPRENPQVVITVLLESAGHGGAEAAPVAKIVMDMWKERYYDRQQKAVAQS